MTPAERVRASYAAFERGDREGALEAFADDVVWEQAQGLPHGGTYVGLDEVRRNVFAPLTAEWWTTFSAAPDEVIDAGEQVVVLGRYRGVARDSQRRLDVPFVHVWSFEGGEAVRFRQFLDTAGWNAALGQS